MHSGANKRFLTQKKGEKKVVTTKKANSHSQAEAEQKVKVQETVTDNYLQNDVCSAGVAAGAHGVCTV
jgi:hypothetical protein